MASRRRVLRVRARDSEMDHYESLPGQGAPFLCGWEGGPQSRERTDEDGPARFCPECAAIYTWARGAKAHASDGPRDAR